MDVLRSETLEKLPPEISAPNYDRKMVNPGIVHFGVGNFHRAHFAPLIDALLSEEDQKSWGISGVGFLPHDRVTRDNLRNQDHLYTLTMKHPDGIINTRVIGSILEMLYRPEECSEIVNRIASPSTQIVSMTITEGGYNIDQATGEFMLEDSWVESDLQNMEAPKSVFGVLCAGLRQRMSMNGTPISILSCDNMLGNGDIAKKAFITFASSWDKELANWMEANVSFPNSMVDRITPATNPGDVEQVSRYLGVQDACSVISEPFWQFIIEDKFAGERPDWERAGVQIVTDIHPYEATKLQLLNGSHQLLTHFGLLLELEYVHDALKNSHLARILMSFMVNEVEPTLPEAGDFDVPGYELEIRSRFGNAAIADTLQRIATNSSDRIQKFILPTIAKGLETGGAVDISGAVIGAWIWRISSGDPTGQIDTARDSLMPDIRITANGLTDFLNRRDMFGNLAENPVFHTVVGAAISRILDLGPEKYIETLASEANAIRRV